MNRLTLAVYIVGTSYTYTYDAVGNRLSVNTSGKGGTYTYDAANRLVKMNRVDHTWDNNGNLLSDGTKIYAYDVANRLTSLSDGTNSFAYAYNGLGDRVQSTLNGVTTQYALDLNTGLTQVLDDGVNTYVYGYTRLAQVSDAQTGYFLTDALGSVRQVTDTAGAITLVRDYSPYGETVQSLGSYETAYSYTGEMTDASGLVYLRARYYDPATGRFVSRDTWEVDNQLPMSYNAWLYGYSNPVLYTDPTGQTPAIIAALLPALVGGAAGFVAGAIAGGIYAACVYELALAGKCGCEMQQQAVSMTKQDWIGAHALGAGIIGGVAGAIAAYGPIGMIAVGVAGAVISGVDIINTYNIIKNETGLTTCTITRLIIDVAAIVFSGVGIVKGVRAWRASGSLLSWISRYPAITPPTNRQGLRIAMGTPPNNFTNPQAHHNLPWTFRAWFAGEGRGLNVNDPIYGRWVEGMPPGSHQSWSSLYEQQWATFIADNLNATRSQVLAYMNRLLSSGRFPSR